MGDPLLESVLREASLSATSHDSITRAYPTLGDLLSATLEELGEVGGGDDAARLWEALERRWRYEAVTAESDPTAGSSPLGRLVAAHSAGERAASLRVQLRVLVLLEETMRAAGFDPDALPAE
jgi:hypothetical protein